jgi:hypothetical protein
MKPLASALLALVVIFAGGAAPTTETIVLIRHGERPPAGLGQLDCQGPDAIYAPDPSETKPDGGIAYDYVRPLATVEPTAIAMGLPVHASIGGTHIDTLQQALERPANRGSLILVAWEHVELVRLVRRLMTDHGGSPNAVPDWKGSDFDSIYIVRLSWTGDIATANFERRAEHLDGQSTICPGPAPHG